MRKKSRRTHLKNPRNNLNQYQIGFPPRSMKAWFTALYWLLSTYEAWSGQNINWKQHTASSLNWVCLSILLVFLSFLWPGFFSSTSNSLAISSKPWARLPKASFFSRYSLRLMGIGLVRYSLIKSIGKATSPIPTRIEKRNHPRKDKTAMTYRGNESGIDQMNVFWLH